MSNNNDMKTEVIIPGNEKITKYFLLYIKGIYSAFNFCTHSCIQLHAEHCIHTCEAREVIYITYGLVAQERTQVCN